MRIHKLVGVVAAGVVLAACGSSNEPSRTPSAIVVVSGNNQTAGAGAVLPQPLVVQVSDRQGDGLAGVEVAFAVTAGGGTVQSATATTNAQGQASTTWTMGTAAGAVNTATAAASGLTVVTFGATVTAGAVASGVMTQGDGQAGAVGTALAQPITAEFRDAFNNLVSGVPVTWAVPAGGGTLTTASPTTDAQGRASASWVLGLEFGNGHVVTATAGGVAATGTAQATLGVGTTLAVTAGDGQTAPGGSALPAALSVRVRTATAQNIAKVPVNWAVATGGGALTQAASLTDVNGVATSGWTLGAGAGSQSVTASNAGTTPTSVTLTATAVAVPPSTISGTVTLSDSLVSSIRLARAAGLRTGALVGGSLSKGGTVVPPMSTVRRSGQGATYVPDELLVVLKGSAISAPAGVRAMASVSTAQLVGQAIRSQLATHAVAGKVAITGVSPVIRTAKLKLADPSKLDSVAMAVAQDPAVESVGRNGWLRSDAGPAHPGVIPNDPFFFLQSWHYSMIDLPRAWSITTGSAGVIVAVLDNGAVFHHPTVGAAGATAATGGGNFRNDGYDFVSSTSATLCAAEGGTVIDNAGDGDGYDADPSTPDDRDPDAQGLPCARSTLGAHGTHVSGTIGAKGDDGVAAVGVNWTVGIRPVRVLGIDGGSYFDIAQGVLYAAGLPADNGSGGVLPGPAQPARIINMSLGGGCPGVTDPLRAAVQAVTNPNLPNGGVLVVVSAGNQATSVAPCPAAYPEVLTVGAVAPSGHRAAYSNFGGFVDIAAPGGDFGSPLVASFGVASATCDFTPFPAPCTPNHAYYTGTSMAAPHVAGVAALLLAADPGLTAAQLRSRLVTYAAPISPGEQIGPGIVNARNSLTQTTAPARQLYVRAVNALTGVTAATVPATGGSYTLGSLPDGSYFVVAGEDESGDGEIGLPGRRLGAFGGISSPTPLAVSGSAGAFAAFTVGYPVEEEPNDGAGAANRLVVDGAVQGSLSASDLTDVFQVQIPVAGTYTFETSGWFGAFCGFALDLDMILELRDQAQATLGTSVDIDTRNFCSRISQSLAPGTYYLLVTRDGSSTGRYALEARTGP
jgi:subtilisin family serine protease